MKIGGIKMRKKVGTSTYIQRINTLERKLLKQVKELDDIMENYIISKISKGEVICREEE
jgi:hypothetical protein